ncbi:MAG: D-alanyl-D-alanine carboxypeptidase [Rickettsiales bacterium]|nr:D-alanyl-D-alanine carboxypeptidase [Rickettsiales bacterium]
MFRKVIYLFGFLFVFSQAEAFSTKARYAFLMDATTNTVLYEKNAHRKMTPSSMSKLMTLYLTFERLKSGNMKLYDNISVSTKAWRMTGSRMFISPNTFVSVENLLRGIIVQSGNDASVAVAEGIAGSESDFVALMNAKAAELGLKNSHFANATGMPHRNHYMSAADIGYLSARIISDFPEYYYYFSEKQFSFNKIKQSNRNTLLHVNGVDGLKTGHTNIGKYGVAVSAVKDGRRLIAVVNGLENERARATEAHKLLQYGFLNFVNINIASGQTSVEEVPVFFGSVKKVKLKTKKDIILTVPLAKRGKTAIEVKYPSVLYAPIDNAKKIGEVNIKLYNGKVYNFDLYPSKKISKTNFFSNVFAKIKVFFKTFSFTLPEREEKKRSFVV